MPQAVAQRDQFAQSAVDVVRFRGELAPIDTRLSVGREHRRDLGERKPRGATERDQREPIQHARIELPAKAAPADRRDEADVFVVSQCGGRNTGLPRDLGDIELTHALDFKWT